MYSSRASFIAPGNVYEPLLPASDDEYSVKHSDDFKVSAKRKLEMVEGGPENLLENFEDFHEPLDIDDGFELQQLRTALVIETFTCQICFNNFKLDSKQVKMLKCRHSFCSKCFQSTFDEMLAD